MGEAKLTEAKLHDGSGIEVESYGTGPVVLLPVNPRPAEGAKADELRRWGMDPALGRSLIDGLADAFRVVAFDYEGHVLANPKPDSLTPQAIADDILAVADAVGADRFAYYGYSWLALSGLQLAIRTDRLSALVMGGFPPIDGPYAQMLRVTEATHELAVSPSGTEAPGADASGTEAAGTDASGTGTAGTEAPDADASAAAAGTSGWTAQDTQAPQSTDDYDWSASEMTMTEPQTRQFVTLYRALRGFDDRAVQERLTCPRLCFAGSADTITYDERWGGVVVDIAGPFAGQRAELESLGWEVRVLDGLDHTQAMQPGHVLPVLRPWLDSALAGR
ncbi:alpha/beta fold hydrolase [Planobispora siamensis]|uniref:Alpha/beta hydrolase n=1 Tax=Planobispora siamensis TaxID=936338 RepID=A0A8J3SFV2_9ACTN|nr:alpha/beta hydrolase [Planobispora siamensis]GIH93577.1 hypothetical protein Psi01_42070 [Planobispora siamensis]